ncbi:MAG: ABC transporter ATP-binding protein [Leptolyngbya foveolarum]|uniref:ABC transporter ATP-binding protein n=1 Tax=Leptolyngbya foveolarum TaxID=47253 RepID=A0A2W4WMP0_9CYAN|nr:MAG: ABC transporter ATP-binding protein [Leptolyngbya foveolarum]
MIYLSDLRVAFSPGTALEKQVFDGLSLTIPAGQFITVIGSNGAGKSTLLNAISGEARPQSGRVTVAGYDITSWPIAKRAKLVSRVFQNPLAGSCAELTLEENLVLAQGRSRSFRLSPALNRSVRAQFRARLAGLSLGLENRLGDRMGLLSGGQRQAASLVMATLAPTQVLLLDEHTAALDPKTASAILTLTQTLVDEQQLTTLMVTHSMQQALDLGDRTLMLHEGKTALDISGDERKGLTVNDLLNAFAQKRAVHSKTSGDASALFSEDSLLLG